VRVLDPSDHELEKIVGQYLQKGEVACGLSDCREPHRRGYIVATTTGNLTNIGKDCGRKYFGVDFEEHAKRFDRDVAESGYRRSLSSFLFQIDEIDAKIAQLRAHGIQVIHRQLQMLRDRSKGCPEPVLRALGDMVKRGDGRLETQREATTDELAALDAAAGKPVKRPHYFVETVGHIRAIRALYPQNDLHQILTLDIEEPLQEFRSADIDKMSMATLKRWSKWAGTIDAAIDQVAQVADAARELLTRDNLLQLNATLASSRERDEFAGFLRTLLSLGSPQRASKG
jgi:hypothetical protein